MPPRALHRTRAGRTTTPSLLAFLLVAAAWSSLFAAEANPTTTTDTASSKSVTGSRGRASRCGDKVPGCVKCRHAGACQRCVDGAFVRNGRCWCPAGTEQVVVTSGMGSRQRSTVKSCAPCADDAYAPAQNPIRAGASPASSCRACPPQTTTTTTTSEQGGGNACYAAPGWHYDSDAGRAVECDAEQLCPGGDITDTGRHVLAATCPFASLDSSPPSADATLECPPVQPPPPPPRQTAAAAAPAPVPINRITCPERWYTSTYIGSVIMFSSPSLYLMASEVDCAHWSGPSNPTRFRNLTRASPTTEENWADRIRLEVVDSAVRPQWRMRLVRYDAGSGPPGTGTFVELYSFKVAFAPMRPGEGAPESLRALYLCYTADCQDVTRVRTCAGTDRSYLDCGFPPGPGRSSGRKGWYQEGGSYRLPLLEGFERPLVVYVENEIITDSDYGPSRYRIDVGMMPPPIP